MRIWPQVILYSADEAGRLGEMMKRWLVPFDELAVLYVLGRALGQRRRRPPVDAIPSYSRSSSLMPVFARVWASTVLTITAQ